MHIKMETSSLVVLLFAILLFAAIFGMKDPMITHIKLGFIGYGAYVMHKEGRLGKKTNKKLKKKDMVKGGSIYD